MIRIQQIVLSDVIIDEVITYSLQEFQDRYDIREALLLEMLEHSLIEPKRMDAGVMEIDLRAFNRMQSAMRLQQDLEINMAGIGLVLELVDQLKEVRQELAVLQQGVVR